MLTNMNGTLGGQDIRLTSSSYAYSLDLDAAS